MNEVLNFELIENIIHDKTTLRRAQLATNKVPNLIIVEHSMSCCDLLWKPVNMVEIKSKM